MTSRITADFSARAGTLLSARAFGEESTFFGINESQEERRVYATNTPPVQPGAATAVPGEPHLPDCKKGVWYVVLVVRTPVLQQYY